MSKNRRSFSNRPDLKWEVHYTKHASTNDAFQEFQNLSFFLSPKTINIANDTISSRQVVWVKSYPENGWETEMHSAHS